MLNQVVLVGRLVNDIEDKESENVIITLAVGRAYKNEEGGYDTDFINVVISGTIAKNTAEYCKKGDILGVKGRVQSDGKEQLIIAEKITFLSSKGGKDE